MARCKHKQECLKSPRSEECRMGKRGCEYTCRDFEPVRLSKEDKEWADGAIKKYHER